MKHTKTDIVICGGGTPGLTLALLLADFGLKSAVVEPAPPEPLAKTKPEGRTSALMAGSIDIIRQTGCWNACSPYGEELRTLRIIDENGRKPGQKKIEADFHACEIGRDYFGINIPNNILRAALYDKARQDKRIRLVANDKLTSIETDSFHINAATQKGKTLSASLLVGADGRHSVVRELSGIKCWQKDYGQSAITCLLHHSLPHNNISSEFHRPGGPFTLVPLPGNVSSLVWVEKSADAEMFAAMSKHAFIRALQDRSRAILGELELISAPQCCPLHALKAGQLTAPRTALIAEAAHALHPLGAQGLNLSLRDVSCLAAVIKNAAGLGLDYGSGNVLGSYEKQRRNDIALRLAGTHGLNKLVSSNSALIHALRRRGLLAVNRLSVIREFAMREGLAA